MTSRFDGAASVSQVAPHGPCKQSQTARKWQILVAIAVHQASLLEAHI